MKYIADDGTSFDNLKDCRAYEKRQVGESPYDSGIGQVCSELQCSAPEDTKDAIETTLMLCLSPYADQSDITKALGDKIELLASKVRKVRIEGGVKKRDVGPRKTVQTPAEVAAVAETLGNGADAPMPSPEAIAAATNQETESTAASRRGRRH